MLIQRVRVRVLGRWLCCVQVWIEAEWVETSRTWQTPGMELSACMPNRTVNLSNQRPGDQALPLLKLHSEGTDCSTAGVCDSTAAIEIRHNWRQNHTAAAAIPRSTHDAGIFVQAFGALGRVCSADASQACHSTSDCSDGAGFCNSRAGSAIHTETRGDQIGIMVDGEASTGPAIRVEGGDLYVTGGEIQIKRAGRLHTVYSGPHLGCISFTRCGLRLEHELNAACNPSFGARASR